MPTSDMVGYAEWPKVANAMIEAVFSLPVRGCVCAVGPGGVPGHRECTLHKGKTDTRTFFAWPWLLFLAGPDPRRWDYAEKF